MFRIVRHPFIWFLALAVWFGVLWFLSELPGSSVPYPVNHFDKFLHFSYFLAGGILCAGGHASLTPGRVDWKRVIATAMIAMACIGFIDEWHQSFSPWRSGADALDWLADVIGGSVGAYALKIVHHRLP